MFPSRYRTKHLTQSGHSRHCDWKTSMSSKSKALASLVSIIWTLPLLVNRTCLSFHMLNVAIQVHFSGNNLYGFKNSGLIQLNSKKSGRVVLPKFSSFRTRVSFPRCTNTLWWLSKCTSNICTVGRAC
jgi:hypothetical protein